MQKVVKMQEIVDFREVVQKFRDQVLPLQGAYKLMKISNSLDKDMEFYSKKFQEIIETYGQKNEDGTYKFTDDNSQILIVEGKVGECNQAIDDLLNVEVTIDNLNLTIDNLGKDIKCTPEELEGLMPFFN